MKVLTCSDCVHFAADYMQRPGLIPVGGCQKWGRPTNSGCLACVEFQASSLVTISEPARSPNVPGGMPVELL